MADQLDDAGDRARTVPLPTDEGEQVIAQTNVGAESSLGSGEWPSPKAPPTEPAPGTSPEGAQAASRRQQAPPQAPSPGSASQDDQQQDASSGGDRGPARTADADSHDESEGDRPPTFKQALAVDPLAAGAQATPRDDPGEL